MSYTKTIAVIFITALTCASSPAFAATQNDVAACRAAVTEKAPNLLDGYRLRFKSEKGYKNRVMSFEAIPNKPSAGERFKLTCKLNQKKTVLAVLTNKNIQYALNK